MTITLSSTLAFTIAMLIVAATPGPAFFSLTARTIANGAVAGIGVVSGIIIADVIYFIFALVGMTSLSETFGDTFIIIKILAGGYLIWLGVQMWRREPIEDNEKAEIKHRGFLKNFVEGLIVNLTNPKAILFFAALLPTFVNLSDITTTDSIALISIVIFVGGIVDLIYVLMAMQLRNKLRRNKTQVLFNRIGGTTLAGVGVVVATR